MYAVITREAEAAAPYIAVLAPLGLAGVALPVTATAPAREPEALMRAVAGGGYAAVVVASARAAAALAEAHDAASAGARAAVALADACGAASAELAEARDAASAGAHGAEPRAVLPEVWAVGPATARALADAGIVARVPTGVRDGAGLARALMAERAVAGQRVLVPRAEEGRDEAIALLRAAGAEVDAIAAYRTVPADAADPALARGLALLRDGAAAVCVVFAPSQVAALDALVGIRQVTARFAAIGETTAQALRAAGATDVIVAGAPSPEGLAKAVSAVYSR